MSLEEPALGDEADRKLAAATKRIIGASKILATDAGRRRPMLFGNAVAINIAGTVFILTAKHVLKETEQTSRIHVLGNPPTLLAGKSRHSPPLADGLDADLALVELHRDQTTEGLRTAAVQLDEVQFGPFRSGQPIVLAGMPHSRYKKARPANAPLYTWTGSVMPEEQMPQFGHRARVHVAFEMDPDLVERDGVKANPGALSGASGAGMWLLPPPGTETFDNEVRVKLCGIFTHQVPATNPKSVRGSLVAEFVQPLMDTSPSIAAALGPHIARTRVTIANQRIVDTDYRR